MATQTTPDGACTVFSGSVIVTTVDAGTMTTTHTPSGDDLASVVDPGGYETAFTTDGDGPSVGNRHRLAGLLRLAEGASADPYSDRATAAPFPVRQALPHLEVEGPVLVVFVRPFQAALQADLPSFLA